MSFETRQVVDVLNNRIPVCIPFIDRMDFWQRGLTFQGRTPEKYQGLSLRQIHEQLGFGMLEWRYPFTYKYHHLEITIRYRDQIIFQAYEPLLHDFPSLWDDLPIIGPGDYHTEAAHPSGQMFHHPFRQPARACWQVARGRS